MKEAIKQILKDNAWEMEKDRYVIGLSNIDEIAEEVVKLFLIPPVIKSVCDQCRFESECRFKTENVEQNCKFFIDKQTVL